ncbi:MAG: sensor histidine kinase, partial [Candidatus Acidiferrales bacterium]
IEGLKERSSFDVVLKVPRPVPRLSENEEIALFRIVQESLTNSLRHSGGRRAAVRVSCKKNAVLVEVSDQIDISKRSAKAPVPGVGIVGMKERMMLVGGECEVVFGVSGTTVRAILPLRDRPHSAERTAKPD